MHKHMGQYLPEGKIIVLKEPKREPIVQDISVKRSGNKKDDIYNN